MWWEGLGARGTYGDRGEDGDGIQRGDDFGGVGRDVGDGLDALDDGVGGEAVVTALGDNDAGEGGGEGEELELHVGELVVGTRLELVVWEGVAGEGEA